MFAEPIRTPRWWSPSDKRDGITFKIGLLGIAATVVVVAVLVWLDIQYSTGLSGVWQIDDIPWGSSGPTVFGRRTKTHLHSFVQLSLPNRSHWSALRCFFSRRSSRSSSASLVLGALAEVGSIKNVAHTSCRL
jgi:hypothetical protein